MSQITNKVRLSKCQWVLILILVSSPLYTMAVGSYNLYFIYMFLFVVVFLLAMRNGNKTNMAPSIKVLLVMLVLGLLCDMILSESPIQSNKVLVLTFLILLYPTNRDTATIIYPALAIIGVVFGLYMLNSPQYLNDIRLTVKVGDWIMDPNWAAMSLFPTFCYGLSLFEKSVRSRILGLVLCLFAIYVIFLTGSRGAFVSLILASIAFSFFKTRIKFSTLIMIVIGCFIAYYAYTRFIPTVDQSLLDRYNGTVDDTGRYEAWGGSLAGFIKSDIISMIIGHGSGSTASDLGSAAHNIFLEQLYVRGLLGLALLIVFLFQFFKETLICRNYIGLYLFFALITSSLFSPVWGGVYMMMPLAAIGYMNNYYSKLPRT